MTTAARLLDADTLYLRHEFLALPGLCLTVAQAARLMNVGLDQASRILRALEEEEFLKRTAVDIYRRELPVVGALNASPSNDSRLVHGRQSNGSSD